MDRQTDWMLFKSSPRPPKLPYLEDTEVLIFQKREQESLDSQCSAPTNERDPNLMSSNLGSYYNGQTPKSLDKNLKLFLNLVSSSSRAGSVNLLSPFREFQVC